MTIYELIYYWDDVCDGTSLNESLLLTDICAVNEKIKEFKENNLKLKFVSANCGNKLDGHYGDWYTYEYQDGSSSNLEIKTHEIQWS